MATDLEIANRALSRVGERRIEAMDENSRAGIAVATHYESTVREILRLVPWTCAKARAALTAAETQPDDLAGFEVAYDVPDDALLILDLASEEEYLREGKLIFTDDTEPVAVYIARPDEADWDDLLASVVELRLASKLAFEVSSKADLGNALFREATILLADARRISLHESRSVPSGAVLWVDA